jgi:ketosteroid isomerase-like protein
VACGSSTPRPHTDTVSSNPELTPAFAKVQGWLGHWQGADGVMTHWIAADGAMYGVWFDKAGETTIHIVDDGQGSKPPDGILRFIAIDNNLVGYGEMRNISDAELRVFSHIDGSHMAKIERGPEDAAVEAADVAFAADVKARKVDGWVAAFDPHGAMMHAGKRIEGAAIHDAMVDTLAEGVLAWAPIASGTEGELGYTVGKATYTPNDPREPSWASTYITIWRHQADGTWKVLFDTGRAVNR